MRTIKISEFKTHISRELRLVRNGERIVVLDRDIPVAEVVPYRQTRETVVIKKPRLPFTAPRHERLVEVDPLEVLLEDRGGR